MNMKLVKNAILSIFLIVCLLLVGHFYFGFPSKSSLRILKKTTKEQADFIEPNSASNISENKKIITKAYKNPSDDDRISDIAQMKHKIEFDILCENETLSKIWNGISDENTNTDYPLELVDKYVALNAAVKNGPKDPCMQAILTKNYKDSLFYSSKNESTTCLFQRALTLSDMIDGFGERITVTDSNRDEAIKILEKLHASDPTNGIYPLFLIPLYEVKNTSREDIENSFLRFITSKKIENPLVSLYVNLKEAGSMNATALSYSIELRSRSNIPNYLQAITAAKKLSADSAFTLALATWMKNYSAHLDKLEKLQLNEPFILFIEEIFLKNFTTNAWNSQNPNKEIPYAISPERFVSFYKKMNQNSDFKELSRFINECKMMQSHLQEYLKQNEFKQKEQLKNWKNNHHQTW